jgi:hypothetical protein
MIGRNFCIPPQTIISASDVVQDISFASTVIYAFLNLERLLVNIQRFDSGLI